MAFHGEPRFSHDAAGTTGVLLVNLGTPDAPTPAAVRRYLREFLWDPRVVEIPRPLWWLILNGVILNVRPRKSAAKYASIWTPEGSPLRVHTERQTRLVAERLAARGGALLHVAHAMRYGTPSIAAGLADLRAAGARRLLVVPLYPQYAASTTATAMDEVFRDLRQTRNLPEVRFVRSFHDHPAYIDALARQVRAHWAAHGRGTKLVMSFHGVPRFTLDKGDPYHCECHVTGRLLANALDLKPDEYAVTFQSRFGKAEWLQPYTEPTLVALAQGGLARVDIMTPGFVADCLETLEEIGMEGRAAFLGAGGREYHALPCLNEDDAWIEALGQIVVEHLGDWAAGPADARADAAARQERKARALAMGAAA